MKYSFGACLTIAFGVPSLGGTASEPPKGVTRNPGLGISAGFFSHVLGAFARSSLCSAGLLVWLCAGTTWSLAADPVTALRPEKLAEMDEAINEAIEEKRCPGGVLWFEHRGV